MVQDVRTVRAAAVEGTCTDKFKQAAVVLETLLPNWSGHPESKEAENTDLDKGDKEGVWKSAGMLVTIQG